MGNIFAKKQIDTEDIPNEKESLESVPTEKAKAVCSSSNTFTQQLYVQLSIGKKENLLLSGFSITTAMAMIFLAARDEASKEIQECFGFHTDLDEHKLGYKDILKHLASCNNKDAELIISQKIFADNRLEIPELFTVDTHDSFGAETTKLDLAEPASADIINKWVKEATKGKIESIANGNDFNSDTLMMLLNAIYFKCNWDQKFNSDNTKEQDFYLSGQEAGPKVKAQMMTLGDVNLQTIFIRSLDARAVELPYKGNKFSMIFILPEREDGFDEMDQRLRDVDLNNELSFGKGRTKFNVKIPKFKLESSQDLNEQLKSLGVKTAFVSGRSNFGGISKEPNQETFLKTVRQKAVIEVDEAGTEAVACTGVVAYAKCAPIQPCSFICNRPFIFLIRQQETGLILFIGRMMNPTQK